MDSPRTPLQSDKGMKGFVQALNLKWRLSLPTGSWSPLPKTNVRTDEEVEAHKCIDCIRLLYFKDRMALERVVKNFEGVTQDTIPSDGWIHKPNQEQDTLPRRSMSSEDRQTDVPRPNHNSLMKRLLKFLESEAEPLRARMRSSSKIGTPLPRARTTTAGSSPPDQADLEGPTLLGQGTPLGPRCVTIATEHSEPVELNHSLASIPGPSQRLLGKTGETEPNYGRLGGDRSAHLRHSAEVCENLYSPLDVSLSAATTGKKLGAVGSQREHTHPNNFGSVPGESNCLEFTHLSRPKGLEDGRIEERKLWLYDKEKGRDDSEDEEYFTSQESPPSPSVDYESRQRAKARKRAEPSFRKIQDWVPVHVPSFPSQGLQKSPTSPAHSRKRVSVDSVEPRHRKSPRACPGERSPRSVKVSTFMAQDNRSIPFFQHRNHPGVPLFPSAPSANTSFTTSANNSFGASIFSDAGGDSKTTNSANTSFRSSPGGSSKHQYEPITKCHSHTEGAEMVADPDGAIVGSEDEAMAIGERGNEDVEMTLLAERGTLQSPNLSRPLRDMAVQSPTHVNSLVSTYGGRIASSTDAMNTSNRAKGSLIAPSIEEKLLGYSPFAQQMPKGLKRRPLRVRYEINRIALECGIPMNELAAKFPSIPGEYSEMWSWFRRTTQLQGKNLPEPSSNKAWESAGKHFDNVTLTGDLLFNHLKENPLPKDGPIFSFRLKPLKLESSCRLFRRLGNDRFIVISLPRMLSLPAHWKVDRAGFQEGVINWLVKGSHEFLGREWKAFYLKMKRGKPNLGAERDTSAADKWLVYFFAVDGCDFDEGTKPPKKGEAVGRHSRMTLSEMLEWFMPFEPNKDKTCCKAFARLALGEIKRIADEKSRTADDSGKFKVMNDGCARISKQAALAVAEMLCLDGNMPSAFQGRIAGAKGLWIVDITEDPYNDTFGDRGYWIEITDEQLKFRGNGHPTDPLPSDLHLPDDDAMTFEVNAWSKPLRAASLNFQLLPILECRGVPRQAIEKHLRDDLEFKVSDLMEALEDPVAFRKWIYDMGDTIEERVKNQGVQFQGGLPISSSERINWFLESGFSIKACAFLRELARNETKKYCDRLNEKMHIEVGQSTYAFCVPDPLGVLEEGEVHFGFSSTFTDPRSSFQDTLLHNRDVLVARLPAALPSDMQKVHAVFKPELRLLKDVIIFSTKGSMALAEKLSGGDYDGDRDFKNAPLPVKPKRLSEQLEYYGITQDKCQLMDLPLDPDERTLQFVLRGFNSSLEEGLMGACTNFHEKFCYQARSIKSPEAIALAILLGLLVDREKQGYTFTEENWREFRRKVSPTIPPKPAYKANDESIKTDHIIDYMVFDVAKPVVEKILTGFQERFPDPPTLDIDLVRLWKQEKEAARRDGKLRQALDNLVLEIDAVWNYWLSCSRDESSFPLRVWRTYSRFNEIMPKDIDHPMLQRWREDAIRSPYSHWNYLRASAAFHKYPKHKFVWWVAGRELGQLKALASSRCHMVVSPIHASYKPDASYVRRIKIGRMYGVDADAESVMGDQDTEKASDDFGESVFGYDDWLDEAL
ncbi:hypothetical protein FGG08_000613 [Glutinoglossum americanum]|uniref:RDRP core domain-containing protein n=1 Tax=Glutinoglossum americanum TaxID=1670608 RepID=A0A9P8I8M2_9PEZI|nr:hypothetical protein FGG08_000613 [Glutinoglossum americanum]